MNRRPDNSPCSGTLAGVDVSVVIPTYRRPDAALSAVLSVLAQTQRPREIVLVIDGEDSSGYEALEQRVGDPILQLVRTGSANGAAGARNIGVQHATSTWVAFLDDDDTFLPTKLERQMLALDEAGLSSGSTAVISTTALVATDGGNRVERWPGRAPRPHERIEDFLFGLGPGPSRFRVLSTCTLLVTRDLLLEVPMRGRAFDDWDWQIRASPHARRHHLDEVLTVVALGGVGLTSGTTLADGQTWLDSMRPLISEAAYAAACLTVLGRLAADKGTLRDSARLFAEAAKHHATARQLAEYPLRVASRRIRRRL
jgi:glycosyltransferase involved in cell wall biosynthesis